MPPPVTARAARPAPAALPRDDRQPAEAADGAAFGAPFWLTYAANTSTMVAVSILYRYGDFVSFLGGDEVDLGWIVAAGMVGSLLMRLAQGSGIDTYGPRRIWLWSSGLLFASCLGHLWVTTAHGPLIYALRVLFQTSVSGFFGASITYISGRAPIARMAEVIGTLGTSGFIGMMIGTQIGDLLLSYRELDQGHIRHLFLAVTAITVAGFVFSWFATRGDGARSKRRQPPMLLVIRRYHPGAVLWAGAAAGFGLGLPTIFLTRYAAELQIPKLAVFFWIYAPTAFATRLLIRRLPQLWGVRPMLLCGMLSLALGILSFLLVSSEWQFAFPAILIGIAHAFVFPAAVAGGSGAFPLRYRGLGTTLMLAMFDLGNLIGMPAVGEMLHLYRRFGLPDYPTMFVSAASIIFAVAAAYAAFSRSQGSRRVGIPRREFARSAAQFRADASDSAERQ
jgi:MFS family permease